MPSHKTLTDTAAQRIRPPASGQIDHFDKTYPGLALRVSYRGRKSWVYFYRFGGKLKRMTMDTYPVMSVAEAHDAWRAARDQVRAGRDPARKEGTGATDFKGVFEEWLARDQAGNKTREIVRRILEKDVLPSWASRQIGEIGRRDVLDIIDTIVDRGSAAQARRVHAYLHRLFAWSLGRGIVEHNPLASLPKPGSETRRDRVLTDAELVAVWKAATKIGFPYGPAVQLLILTGARREEIGQLRWSEIEQDSITLAADRTKTSVAHVIPLSAPARAIIEALPRISGSPLVFTHDGRKPIASWHKAKPKLDQLAGVGGWIVHDLRRTCATGLQKLGTPLQVTEAVLGHTAGSRRGVIGIYQRHDYANEKRAALEAWGAHVVALGEGRQPGTVVPMHRAEAVLP
jgi:integrase